MVTSSNVAAVVPAAGLSTRMGFPKPCLAWKGMTLLEHMARTLKTGRADPIVVVLGYQAELVKQSHAHLTAEFNVVFAYNPDYATDQMLSSVKVGLAALAPCQYTAFLVCPVDMPLITPDVVTALIRSHEQMPDRIVIPTFNGRNGHPALFPMTLRDEVLGLPPDSGGLKAIRQAHASTVVLLPVDCEGILIDLDTPAEYRMWHNE